ncbi:hypothetical protein [Haloferula sp.]|uniref:hypothetical protein n=1 Tax=Haloferula sp. TaxID=2497595 RepID=UPI003C753CDF
MNGRRELLIVVAASILLALCLVGGFGAGYFSGHRQAVQEAGEDQFLHVGHEVERSAFVSYLDTFRFHLSGVAGWILIALAASKFHKRYRGVPVLCLLVGSALVLIADIVVLAAETAEYWVDDFLWSSPLGRTAMVIQHAEYLGLFLFGYGLVRFATSTHETKCNR